MEMYHFSAEKHKLVKIDMINLGHCQKIMFLQNDSLKPHIVLRKYISIFISSTHFDSTKFTKDNKLKEGSYVSFAFL